MEHPFSLESAWPSLISRVSGSIDVESSARSSRALTRRREIRSGEALLRLILGYGPCGMSLRGAAAWAGASGLANLSDTAVMNRVRQSGDWLGQIAGALLDRDRAAPALATLLPGRRLRLVDGSVITQPGSTGTDWRLHASYDPVGCRFTDLELTDAQGAERLARATVKPGDIIVADRNYAKPAELKSVLDQQGDFVVRIGCTSLRLLTKAGAALDWDALFDSLAAGCSLEQTVQVVHSGYRGKRGQPWFEARLILRRGTPEAAALATKRVTRSHSKRRSHAVLQPLTVKSAGFVMLLTSLPHTLGRDEVLAAYRLRWQVELAFKRLKTLIGIDRLPAKSRELARSWLLAHLVMALLIEDLTQQVLDSPPCTARNANPSKPTVARRPTPA